MPISAARRPRSVVPWWPAGEDQSSIRKRRRRALGDVGSGFDADATTWPSYKKRKQARLFQLAFFVAGVTLGVVLVFAGELDEQIAESRMWIAHELRAMKQNPTDEDLALPRPHRMVARPPRKQRQSLPSVRGVPVLDVTELPSVYSSL